MTILDVKCPGSGEVERNDWDNLDRLRPHDEVKFVVKDRADYEYARDVIARHELAGRAAAIHLSPVHGVLDPKTLSEWVLADRLPVRVQLQLHKYIWNPDDARCLTQLFCSAAGSIPTPRRRSRGPKASGCSR